MKTRMTELLGIKHPIALACMGSVSTAPLVIGVTNAGGLGLLNPLNFTADMLREEIRKIRDSVGNKPFGVGLIPHMPRYPELVKVILEEKVPVVNHGMGIPAELLNQIKPLGLIGIPSVGRVQQAIRAERDGAAAVMVAGHEAGGDCGPIGSAVLIPQVAESVKIPVIAAGGFCDGRGLAGALALGADGIYMGTRFAATQESPVPLSVKQRICNAKAEEARVTNMAKHFPLRAIVGKKARLYPGWQYMPWEMIRGVIISARLTKVSPLEYWRMALAARREYGTPLHFLSLQDKGQKGLVQGDVDRGFFPAGQVVGRLHDIPTCQEVIERTVAQAEEIIKSMQATAD